MLREGKSCFQEGRSFFHKGTSCFQEGKSCFQGKAHLETKPRDHRRPRSGQDCPGRNFPDLRFFAEVGRQISRSEASRRSGVGCAAGGLRGGRAADLTPGGFAEVGNASKAGPGGQESTCLGRGQANPSQARIFPTSANSRRSGKFLPSRNLPDIPSTSSARVRETSPITKANPAIQVFHFPIKKLAVRNYAKVSPGEYKMLSSNLGDVNLGV